MISMRTHNSAQREEKDGGLEGMTTICGDENHADIGGEDTVEAIQEAMISVRIQEEKRMKVEDFTISVYKATTSMRIQEEKRRHETEKDKKVWIKGMWPRLLTV